MNAKHILYIVYLFMIFINNVVLGSAGITLKKLAVLDRSVHSYRYIFVRLR